MNDLSALDSAILYWNIRNIESYNYIIEQQRGPGVRDSCPGEYPSDAWIDMNLAVPRDGYEYNISGRGHTHHLDGRSDGHPRRTVHLPRYLPDADLDTVQLRVLIQHWKEIGIPDDVPSAAIAIKMGGLSSDYREMQYLNVLLIWSDGSARIMRLECFEGPLEDCITPEWYAHSSALMNIHDAIMEFGRDFSHGSINNINFSISTIPICLGSNLKGRSQELSPSIWHHEFRYEDLSSFESELGSLLTEVRNLFEEEVSK